MPNVAAGAALIVAGCMPARYGQDLESELSEASAFVPCSKEDDIVQVIAQALGIDQARLGRMKAAMLGAVPEGAVAINGSRAGRRQGNRSHRPRYGAMGSGFRGHVKSRVAYWNAC